MIRLYKSKSGNLIKESLSYKTGYLSSIDKGYSWQQLKKGQAQVLIRTGVYRLVGNNFRLK